MSAAGIISFAALAAATPECLAGIGACWELSQAGVDTLAQILEASDFQKVDLAAIRVEALRLAEETGTVERTWDGAAPDDFEPFEGIGQVYDGRLYDAGIYTYRALANATVEQFAEICEAPGRDRKSVCNATRT